MQFYIDSNSGIPLYIQLQEQIEQSIVSGVLQPGDKLPTVRDMAVDLTINPNTVARVYRELEQEGLLETKRGVGTYIAEEPDISEIISEKEIEWDIEELITKALQLNIKPDVLLKRFNRQLKKLSSKK